MTKATWTLERIAMLRAEYPSAPDNRVLLARVNARPGAPVSSVKALGIQARKLGLHKTAEAMRAVHAAQAEAGRQANGAGRHKGRKDRAPRRRAQRQAPAVIVAPVPHADPGIARYQAARQMLAAKRPRDEVMTKTRLPLREVLRIAGELARERAA